MKSDNFAITGRSRRFAAILGSIALVAFAPCALLVSRWPKAEGGVSKDARPAANLIDPLTIALAPQTGDNRSDREISRLQQGIGEGRDIELTLEQLGWAFVTKARESFDAGFYKLAEQCALGIEKRNPQSQAAMLLRGHVLQNLHQFKESEALARRLVDERGLCFDYGLLGDALMEQGRLKEAVEAYQRMMNLKPDLHAYARAAHMRWLKGDLDGAIEAMQLAVSAASPLDPESAAWVNARLAYYEFQAGRLEEAEQRCAFAESYQHDYAPALLLRGKMLLAQNMFGQAVKVLQTATKVNPLPEYQWALAEALRAAGREDQAAAIEAQFRKQSAGSDPRTYSLFLATRHESPETALQVAKAEFCSRNDVFTLDALAWALAAAGQFADARTEIERALTEGTQDGRLFFHAAMIASQSGENAELQRWLNKANSLSHLLLPSERNQLQNLLARCADRNVSVATKATNHFSSQN
jgi:tetratricopeptide (TPR) repeat protein